MSRLENHKKKVFITQIVLSVFAFIIVIGFIITAGFKMLLNSSVFVNQLFNKKNEQTTTKEKEIFQGDFSIDSIPTATNSAKIIVSGSINGYNSLILYLNKKKVREIPVASDSFTIEVGNLKKGDNEVYFLAKSPKNKQEKQSETFNIIYKDERPKLEIKEPSDQLKTNKQEINIIGQTDKENTVRINSLPVVVDYQGNFQTSVKLNDGENKVNVLVEDLYGNFETKTFTVFYQKDY